MENKNDKTILDKWDGIKQNGFKGLKSEIKDEASKLEDGIEKKIGSVLDGIEKIKF
ncbi:MAG: hypothetical protein KAQ64_00245 [Candidatus Pacebacteria bacterium]|nr:hypothetical protein [Candidatus Paceibacterota bacterium]